MTADERESGGAADAGDLGRPEHPETGPAAAPPQPILEFPEIGRWDVACIGPLMLINLWFLVGRFFTAPLLKDHFVLLEAIRGSFPSMITAGASVKVGLTPLWVAVLAPLPILIAIDPFIYWAGRRYGRTLINHLAGTTPKWRRRIAFGERFFRRWGIWTILFSYIVPASGVCFFLAGEVGMSFPLFAAADIAGTLLYISLMVGLGHVFSAQALPIADTITHYGLWITGALIVLVVLSSIRGARAQVGALTPVKKRAD